MFSVSSYKLCTKIAHLYEITWLLCDQSMRIHSFKRSSAFFLFYVYHTDCRFTGLFGLSCVRNTEKKLITSCSFNPDLSDGKHIFSYHTLFSHCAVLFDFILAFYHVRKCPNSYISVKSIFNKCYHGVALLFIFNACQQSPLSLLNG